MKKLSVFLVAILLLSSCASIIASTLNMKQEDPAYTIKPAFSGENRAVATFFSPGYLRTK